MAGEASKRIAGLGEACGVAGTDECFVAEEVWQGNVAQ